MKFCKSSLLSVFVFSLTVLLSFPGCKKDVEEIQNVTQFDLDNQVLAEYLNLPIPVSAYESIYIPSFLDSGLISRQDNTPLNNPITNDGATLGRVLFYDKVLSANQTVSCATCHIQEFGFSDTAVLSSGFDGGKTGRHSMGLTNARFRENGHFFWDERAETLEDQVLGPIQDPVEMGMGLIGLVDALEQQPYYSILFNRAFGDEEITSEKVSLALAQFVRSMVSFNSKYDEGRRNHAINESFSNFSAEENLGKELFNRLDKGACFSCHFTEAMITDVARNNGLSREISDIGVEGTTGDPLDRGKFKAPSLRNVAVRAPYMHHGGIKTLKEVILAYSSGINWSPTLDPHLMMPGNNSAVRFNLSSVEVDALDAFLKTLTDHSFLTNEIYADPFVL